METVIRCVENIISRDKITLPSQSESGSTSAKYQPIVQLLVIGNKKNITAKCKGAVPFLFQTGNAATVSSHKSNS